MRLAGLDRTVAVHGILRCCRLSALFHHVRYSRDRSVRQVSVLLLCVIYTTCAVGVRGRLAAPEHLLVSPVQGDFVALYGRKRAILGGFATLQTSPQQATA